MMHIIRIYRRLGLNKAEQVASFYADNKDAMKLARDLYPEGNEFLWLR